MTNKEVLKKMFGIDLDHTNLMITCSMLRCTQCPHQHYDDCLPFTGDEDITKDWLEMEWR